MLANPHSCGRIEVFSKELVKPLVPCLNLRVNQSGFLIVGRVIDERRIVELIGVCPARYSDTPPPFFFYRHVAAATTGTDGTLALGLGVLLLADDVEEETFGCLLLTEAVVEFSFDGRAFDVDDEL